MSNVKDFLRRKDIVITPQRYLIEALGAMAQGLFASLLIGTIIKTLGTQLNLSMLTDIGTYAMAVSGPAMAVAIGYALQAPPMVLFSLSAVGWAASLSAALTSGAFSTAASIPHALLSTVLLVMGTYYMTADRARIAAFFHRTFPGGLMKRGKLVSARLWKAVLLQVRSQLMVSLAVTLFLMIALAAFRVRYGLLIGLGIGVADALPVLGAGLFLIPWSIAAFVAGDAGLGVLAACLYVGTVVIRQVLEPRIVGHNLGLYPLATMAAMYAGYRLLGFLGLLAGPVLLNVIVVVLEADERASPADPRG